ncbi:AcrR family transcriptional regulator [Acetoanaerobium pronyense]|uniref:AcrR family transcriptional regulator n=1 Tax=Acetoanaerobium pronyense TaxID=1482736 RepID=A0ABS4KK11_9FIRM|nr:TetR/AcrR family transcriptional regulator [Acetoanaerobium pronyense]MBP2028127.1 AcrR family transcriptional regulator [Acetoanaerobium pronyense]
MTKQRLMNCTFKYFSKKGYNASLSEISKCCGIKKQSIYNHFKNKDDLFYQVIDEEVSTFFKDKIEEFSNLQIESPEEKLKAIFFSFINYYKDIEKLRFWRFILFIESEELFLKSRDLIREKEIEFAKNIIGEFEKVLSKNNPEVVLNNSIAATQTFMTCIHGILDGFMLYRGVFDIDILANNVWNLFWNGVERTN